jgi:hypothetical protein
MDPVIRNWKNVGICQLSFYDSIAFNDVWRRVAPAP